MAFGATFNLTTLDGANGFRLDGVRASSGTGQTLANIGDVNGDGYDDLIIGTFTMNGQQVVIDRGETYIIYGGPGGFPATASLSSLNGTNGALIRGLAATDKLTDGAPAGDVNGDGIDDFLVLSSLADTAGRTNNGAAYVIYGKVGGFGAGFDLSTLNGQNGFVIQGAKDVAFISSATGVGDVNGDGYDDILVASNFANPREFSGDTNLARVGVSFLVYGGPQTAAAFDLNVSQDRRDLIFGAKFDDQMGLDARRGLPSRGNDINGDGLADLLLSAPPADALGRTDTGEGYLIFGDRAGIQNRLDMASAGALDGVNGVRIVGQAGDRIAISSLGDVNGDGIDDMAVSARAANAATGRIYVVYGKTSDWAPTLDLGALDASAGFRIEGVIPGAFLGLSLQAVGDLNGDGINEIAATTGVGAYIIYGTTAARGATFDLSAMTASTGFTVGAVVATDVLGWNPSGPDINGDGLADLALGATGADNGFTDGGSVYVVFGQAAAGVPGTGFSDNFIGAAGRDIVNLLAGDDAAKGGGGDDVLRGGPGSDVSIYDGSSANYEWWSVTGGGWRVRDLRAGSPDGTDLLTGFEQLQFADRTVKIEGLTTAEKLIDAYSNILRTTATDSELTFLTGLVGEVSNGSKTLAAAYGDIAQRADGTTAVAAMTYQFFLGFVPSKGGFDFLVSPTGPNPTNINSPYYQFFNQENRYINFAVNVGAGGDGKAAFQAEFGHLALRQATSKAYAEIFGNTPSQAKLDALLDASIGGGLTRKDYLAAYGGDGVEGLGTKAAMVGFLLSAAALENQGFYARSTAAYLADLADGAQFLVDIIGTYNQPDWAFGG